MAGFDLELPACVGHILGEAPPATDGDALLFVEQWLGGRNLGLVPVGNPETFERPGYWIARVVPVPWTPARENRGLTPVLGFGSYRRWVGRGYTRTTNQPSTLSQRTWFGRSWA